MGQKLKTITREVPAKTEELELDVSQLRFTLHFADDATPASSGGPGSLHVTVTAATPQGEPLTASVVLSTDGAKHFERGKGVGAAATTKLNFAALREFLTDLAEQALGR